MPTSPAMTLVQMSLASTTRLWKNTWISSKAKAETNRMKKGAGEEAFLFSLNSRTPRMKNSAICRKVGKERPVQEDAALEKEIKDDGGRQQNGGDLQRLAADGGLEESQGEKSRQDPKQDVIDEIEAADLHQQVFDLQMERRGDQQQAR